MCIYNVSLNKIDKNKRALDEQKIHKTVVKCEIHIYLFILNPPDNLREFLQNEYA